LEGEIERQIDQIVRQMACLSQSRKALEAILAKL
jgi:hypothetical protein